MILSRVSIQRPILASMMNLVLVLFGLIGLSRLPVRELPDIDPPVISVSTIFPGANPQVVETEVTERLEEAINNIEGIKTLRSESREGASNISIEFDLSRDIDVVAQDVRDRVGRVRGRLPQDIREPIIAKQDSDAQPILWISMFSDRYSPMQMTTLAEQQIKPRLQAIPGVSSIMIGGEKRFAMRLWLDSEKMAARQVTVLDVERALREQNIELPSGRVENIDREMTIQTRGELKTEEEFNNLVIRTDGAAMIRMRDIGRAEAGVEDYRTTARTFGKPCIFLGVVKQAKANTVAVARTVRSEIAAIQPTLPEGCDLIMNYDSSLSVERAILEVWETLGIAFLLVVLIIFVFLRNVRSTVIPSVAIPVSIVGTFALLYALGYSVNILTMLALVLSIGIVVDDAIVVLEAIYRHMEEGMPPMKAAFKAMEEISFAVIAITISLVAVFTPLAFQKTTTGRLFIEFAVAVAGSVVISAFVALTLSPTMSARILKPLAGIRHGPLFNFFERAFDRLARDYGRTLRWALRHRAVVLLVAIGSLVLMVMAYRGLEQDFLPQEDKGRMFCLLITPNGSTSEYTDRQLRKAERIIASVPEVISYGAIVAPGFGGAGQASFAVLFVTFTEKHLRQRSVQEIVYGPGGVAERFQNEVEGGLAMANLPKAIEVSFGASFELILQNQDLNALSRTAQDIANRIRGLNTLRNVRVGFEVDKPEIRVAVDRNRAATLGVSIEDISRTMQVLFGGLDLSRIKVSGKEYYVMAQLERKSRLRPQDLDRVFIRSSKGELIQLSSLVSHTQGAAPNSISHYARLRSASISASPGTVPIGTVVKEVEAILAKELPPGFLYAWGGDARNLRDASNDLWWVLSLAAIIVYMTLAAQFESLIHPLTVMLSLPLAGVGAFGLLWLLDLGGKAGLYPPISAMNINLFSQIGLVLLIGLVTKNSILLVEYANQQRIKGIPAHEAMLAAGLIRLRPILMTAFSTIAGILPIAVGFGAGAESRRPMGVAVVGGMLTSTFLTLLIVPVVYTVFSNLAERFHRKPQEVLAASETGEVPAK
ncbi:MAG TPA: efflux RND transporter permease subunit [Candidatus Paceibacterota bacterium]|nr:efflux RND transporter permease subunit [Verrucomicrobiota bacterium]HRY51713.1 efflux RND transporter permease subunit [Candidatus Paceibacterota bacterium]HSA00891.1 efflux RND transporter permease subunit [Candidatus Paceibacterota bacterium]